MSTNGPGSLCTQNVWILFFGIGLGMLLSEGMIIEQSVSYMRYIALGFMGLGSIIRVVMNKRGQHK
jgi:hypothetical protein